MTDLVTVDRSRLAALLAREREAHRTRNPQSAAAYAAAGHLFGRVPMTWMNKLAGAFPLYLEAARGARVTDLDGHTYLDFALGDTAAMAGHSPAPVTQAVQRRLAALGGATAMMPTTDAEWVGAELTRRFGLSRWSFALTATDANRWAIRLVRAVTGRPKILFHAYCYHGSVDESLIVVGPDGNGVDRDGNVGAPVPVAETSRVAEYNDLVGLERELAYGDVAAVLIEPALTNIGIVLPEPGYLEGVRELTRRYGTLLINDETHTFSAGPGGCTAAWGLSPDLLVIGKAIGGGIPAAAYGMSAEFADRVLGRSDLDLVDMGGVGGTMAGNALSVAATRATLEHVLTDAAFESMEKVATSYAAGVQAIIDDARLPWSVSQLGARVEYRFSADVPRNGTQSHMAFDADLDDFLHIYLANRDILLTPFHNMALMAPVTMCSSTWTCCVVQCRNCCNSKGFVISGGFRIRSLVVGLDGVLLAGGAGPADVAGDRVGVQGPVRFVLEPVMGLAERMQIATVGAATARLIWAVRLGVVELAALRAAAATGEDAGRIPGTDVAVERGTRGVAGAAEIEQRAGVRIVNEPAPLGISRESARERCRQRPVTGELRGIVTQAEQGRQVHRQVEVDRHRLTSWRGCGAGLLVAGDEGKQRVGAKRVEGEPTRAAHRRL